MFALAIVAAVLAAQGVLAAEELRRTSSWGTGAGQSLPPRTRDPARNSGSPAGGGFTGVIVPLRQSGEANSLKASRSLALLPLPSPVAFLRSIPTPVDPTEVVGERGQGTCEPIVSTWQMSSVRSRPCGPAKSRGG